MQVEHRTLRLAEKWRRLCRT